MRKRIVIAATTAVVVIGVGVLVYVLSQPKKGSLEWHKREYQATMKRLAAGTWKNKLRRVCGSIFQGKAWERSHEERVALFEKLRHHENRLVALGFLEAREIAHEGYTNRLGDETIVGLPMMVIQTHGSFSPNGLTGTYDDLSPYARSIPSGLVTIVIGLPDDIPKLETIIREKYALEWRALR